MRHITLYKSIPLILISFIILAALSTCRNHESGLYPFGWSLTDPEFDSVTSGLERAFLNIAPDSTVTALVNKMAFLAEKDLKSSEKQARFHYWHARMTLRKGDIDDAMNEFNQAIQLTDSARHPYDIARIRWNMDLEEEYNVDSYFRYLDNIEFFKRHNDIPMQAAYYMTLGNMMVEVGDPESGLNYYNTADSLLRICGLNQQAAGLAISRARCLEKSGNEPGAAEMLRNALKDSLFCNEPVAVSIAHWNLYLYTDSLPILQQAFRDLDNDIYAESVRSLYGACLIREYAKRGMTDSIPPLIPITDADSANLAYDNYRRDFYLGRAAGEAALGHHKEANDYYARAASIIKKMLDDGTPDDVVNLELRRQIEEKVHRLEIQRKDSTLWLLAALAATALIAAIIIFLYQRRLNHQQNEKLKAEMAEKQALRKVLALELTLEENRRMDYDISNTVGSLEKEGHIGSAASNALKATLKTHRANHPAQDSFLSTFSDVNPDFLEALDRKYPNLTKTDRRLAAFISIGLDTKHIARLTGTRPESVKQARWRLRSKMGVGENESLEDAIRAVTGDSPRK